MPEQGLSARTIASRLGWAILLVFAIHVLLAAVIGIAFIVAPLAGVGDVGFELSSSLLHSVGELLFLSFLLGASFFFTPSALVVLVIGWRVRLLLTVAPIVMSLVAIGVTLIIPLYQEELTGALGLGIPAILFFILNDTLILKPYTNYVRS
ncbi:MAG: hypothetical protein AAGH41_05905 [Pseudomonadota bacterium]